MRDTKWYLQKDSTDDAALPDYEDEVDDDDGGVSKRMWAQWRNENKRKKEEDDTSSEASDLSFYDSDEYGRIYKVTKEEPMDELSFD